MTITVKRVTVERAEGPTDLCVGPINFTNVHAADKYLWEISATAPCGGGYDKCDVVIELEGVSDAFTTIRSRHDTKHFDPDGTVLGHAADWLRHAADDTRSGMSAADREEARRIAKAFTLRRVLGVCPSEGTGS